MARHARPDERPLEPGTATADFHAHTRRSDGVLEPAELVRQAFAVGVRTFAIADHDNLAAYRELTAPVAPTLPRGFTLIPAVEINAVAGRFAAQLSEGELHILGLGVDPGDAAFEAALVAQRDARRIRFYRTVDRLRDLGLAIDAQVAELDVSTDDALGRPTIARALMAAGHAADVQDAFNRLIGHGCPAYVPRSGLDPIAAIRAIRSAGGIASLAHFGEAPTLEPLVRELMGAGLDALETHHRSFDAATRDAMSAFARSIGLVETGGSDYHGDHGPYAETHAELVVPPWLIDGVLAALSSPRAARP
ncbi:MAG: PHP domain-containing protein [Candidatus Limnocylindrales bacterium]